MRSRSRDVVVLEEGRCTAVNDSLNGMRLLLNIAPVRGQILEIHTDDLAAVSIVEVCWTKPLVRNEREWWYLVGCRVSFGSMRPGVGHVPVYDAKPT